MLRQEQKSLTRQRILRSAAQIFAAQGLVATKTEAIARGAGVAHGSVFAHFATRDELVSAVMSDIGAQIFARMTERVSKSGSLRALLAAHLESLKEYESIYTRFVREAALLPDNARRAMVNIQSAIATHMAEMMERELAAGRLRPLPLSLTFNTWIGLVHHYLLNGDLFAPRGSVLERWGDQLIDYFMELIGGLTPNPRREKS